MPLFNSSTPHDAYAPQWTRASFDQIMSRPLFGAKPLSEAMLAYCELYPWEQISVKFELKRNKFDSRKWFSKYHLRYGGHSVSVPPRITHTVQFPIFVNMSQLCDAVVCIFPPVHQTLNNKHKLCKKYYCCKFCLPMNTFRYSKNKSAYNHTVFANVWIGAVFDIYLSSWVVFIWVLHSLHAVIPIIAISHACTYFEWVESSLTPKPLQYWSLKHWIHEYCGHGINKITLHKLPSSCIRVH